ncbi:MAG: hypothetical protein JNK45_19250 [Myxococcales bacterium]|nr:hypothetical protein [Myxococcales bacterium]
MSALLHRLAAPDDRVLFALLALVLGYLVLGAMRARHRDPRAARTIPAFPHDHAPP